LNTIRQPNREDLLGGAVVTSSGTNPSHRRLQPSDISKACPSGTFLDKLILWVRARGRACSDLRLYGVSSWFPTPKSLWP